MPLISIVPLLSRLARLRHESSLSSSPSTRGFSSRLCFIRCQGICKWVAMAPSCGSLDARVHGRTTLLTSLLRSSQRYEESSSQVDSVMIRHTKRSPEQESSFLLRISVTIASASIRVQRSKSGASRSRTLHRQGVEVKGKRFPPEPA